MTYRTVIKARLASIGADKGTKPRTSETGRYGIAMVTRINATVDHRRIVPGLLR
jgi:hypothetical protein